SIRSCDKAILIVEADRDLEQWLLEQAHDAGCRAIVTPQRRAALASEREYAPIAITVDLQLPDIEGDNLLERMKSDLSTRHVPVIALSTHDSVRQSALKYGAIAAL